MVAGYTASGESFAAGKTRVWSQKRLLFIPPNVLTIWLAQTYRDAVEFKNGVKLRLQDLEEGQSVEVLALSSENADVQEDKLLPAHI
jgi:hypothetical protein